MIAHDAQQEQDERDAKVPSRATLARAGREVLRDRWVVVAGLSLVALATAATLAEPWLLGVFIDRALLPRDWALGRWLVAAFLGVTALRAGAGAAQGYVFEKLGNRVMQRLRVRLFAHVQCLPVSTFDRTHAGRLITRVTNDVASMSEVFSSGFVMMVGNALLVLGIVGWLLWLDWRLALTALAPLPPLAVASVYFSRRLHASYREARSRLSSLNAFLAENILGMRVVQLFNRQRLHQSRFDAVNERYAAAQIGTVKVFALFQPSITLAQGAAMAMTLAWGGWLASGQAAGERLPLGVLVAFFSYVLALFQPLREIADKWNVFLSGMASAERIFEILDWPVEQGLEAGVPPVEPYPDLKGEIVFENVWFAYDGVRWVLKDFSARVAAGTKLGVVGHTGAGKTTLIGLLLRFHEPQKGRILLDGRDLREYDRRRLRASIGLVQQDVFLFSGSVRDNVTLWREGGGQGGADIDDELVSAIGGGKELGERGANLSVGERQVLAFARARAARPSLWILDEATASVDSSTEARLEAALRDASSARTSILIAHRLSTVRDADQIVVLHKGALVERGRHSELVALDGLYARLYRYQAAAERAPPA